MNLDRDQLQFMLNNNPEHLILSIIEDQKQIKNDLQKQISFELNQLKSTIYDLNEEIKYYNWYVNLPFLRKLWYALTKKNIRKIYNGGRL